MQTFLNVVFTLGIIQGFIFIFYWLFIKKIRLKPIVYLNIFVLFLTLNNVQILIFINEIFTHHFYLKHIEFSWYLLILPYFLVFITSYFEIENPLKHLLKICWGLFLGQIIVRLIILGMIYFQYYDETTIINYTKIEELVNLVISLFIFYKIYCYIFEEHWSEKIRTYDDLNWLKSFFIAGCFVVLFWIFAVLLNLVETTNSKFMYNPLRVSSAVLLYWIGYMGMLKMNLTFERKSYLDYRDKSTKKDNQDISIDDFNKINDYIDSNLRFTDVHLSLDRLAVELQMNRVLLSKIINTHAESFSDFINKKRVEEAKRLLISDDANKFTLDVLAYECGFKSKSNFYLIFKKYMGSTPAEWKKNRLNDEINKI